MKKGEVTTKRKVLFIVTIVLFLALWITLFYWSFFTLL